MNYNTLHHLVIEWAKQKQIIGKASPSTQTLKAASEMGELCDAVIKGDRKHIQMEMGDVIVTLIILCHMLEIDLTDCLEMAYNKISSRSGVSLPNGVFVKD